MSENFNSKTDSLELIVKNCEEFSKVIPMSKLSFEYGIGLKFKETGHEKDWLVHSLYYRNMAAFCKLYGIKRVLEIGTQTGAGSIALAEYSDRVVSVDMSLRHVAHSVFKHPRIELRRVPGDEDCTNIDFSKFDMIFVDIDHSGNVEYKLHRKFMTCYRGYVFWDDITFSAGMKNFWRLLKDDFNVSRDESNYFETNWHDQLGFGISKYNMLY